MRRPRHPAWLRYGSALLVTGAALAIKLLLVPLVTHDEPVLLFVAAVIVAAAFGGLGPGLFATFLSAGCDAFFFMAPFDRPQLNNASEVVRLAIFVAEGIFISLICARMKSAQLDAQDNAADAQELEGELLQISEAEQRRLGHDLHDGLGQQLTGIALMTRRLEEMLPPTEPAGEEAARVCALAKEAIEWTRDLCRSLAPATIETAGFESAIRELAGHAEVIFHVRCDVEQQGEINGVSLAAGTHLYRIAQEAISNAVRHGHAKRILLRLENSGGKIAMQIIDDGTGIDPTQPSTNGMGLKIMRYRAQMIGATVEVTTRKEGGTIVICSYRPANHAKA